MDHAYKSQLQPYIHKRNIYLPVYTTQEEGPPRALSFRSKVTVSGQIFECKVFFLTLKTSEQEAAKIGIGFIGATIEFKG